MKTKTTLLLLAMASFLATLAPAQTVGGIKNITDNKAGISYNANARTVTNNYTVQPEDHTLLVNATTAALTAGATVAFAPDATTTLFTLTPGEAETINGTTTNAVKGRLYTSRVLTSGTSSYVLTFSTNFKVTGTLATGTVSAKTFAIHFVFDGTNFVELSRTTAM